MLDSGRLAAASIGWKTLFNRELALAADMALAERLATRVESNGSEETYGWLAPAPGLSEWFKGMDRAIQKLRAFDYTIKNVRWANGLEIDEIDFQDEKLGLMSLRVKELALQGPAHYVKLLVDQLAAGFTTLCYDGQYFFDTDHQDGVGPVQSNKQAGVLSTANYNAAYAKMMEIKNENGDPLGARPTHLVCGASNRATALAILKAEADAGTSNINAASAELIISPRLTGASAAYWFLLDLSRPLKPLILQIRQPIVFASLNNLSDEIRFMKGKFIFGAEGRHAVGYGLWHLAVGSNGT